MFRAALSAAEFAVGLANCLSPAAAVAEGLKSNQRSGRVEGGKVTALQRVLALSSRLGNLTGSCQAEDSDQRHGYITIGYVCRQSCE